MADILKNDWADLLNDEFQKEYYLKLRQFLLSEYHTKTVYPDMYDIFNALHYTAYKDVKAVILPWSQAGARAEFFRTAGRPYPAVSAKYLPRTAR